MRSHYLIILIVLLAMLPSAIAVDGEISYYLAYNQVLVDNVLEFGDGFSGHIDLDVPQDAKAITVKSDVPVKDELVGHTLGLDLNGSSEVRVTYITTAFIEQDRFIATLESPMDMDSLKVKVQLPEDSVLAVPVVDGKSRSVFPDASRIGTNGRVLEVFWDLDDVEKGYDMPIFIDYEVPGRFSPGLLVIILILFICVLGGIILYQRRKTAPKETIKQDITNHLKEDEEQIVNILKAREGACEQGTLMVVSGFSKAGLSRLLSELEERNIVLKEKKGKKNIIHLR